MIDHSDSWSTENAVKYYSSHRNSVDEIYDSENFFLSQILEPGFSVLDLGCAAGGFYQVFKSFEPAITYTGVDISEKMIRSAQHRYPGIPFHVAEGSDLPFKDQSFDLVFCSGALHLADDWREILHEGWRVTKQFFIFDIRITELSPTLEDIRISYEKIAFNNEWDGISIVPYIIVNIKDFLRILSTLDPAPTSQRLYGYYHPVSEMTVSTEKQVCMTMCCLGKTKKHMGKNTWEIPINKPVDL